MTLVFGSYELDEDLYELRRNGDRIAVQPKVLALLFFLVRERARTVTKAEVLDAVWPGVFVGEASLIRAVSEARRAIQDRDQSCIVTVRTIGFRFAADVRTSQGVPRSERTVRPATEAAPKDRAVVGRDACLAVLRAGLRRAQAARGSLTLIAGEAGGGKTFLSEVFAEEAAASHALVAWARIHRAEGAPPYWCWTQIARALGEESADVERLVDEARAAGNRESDLFPRYDAVTRAIASTASRTPLVLVFDDLDLAGEASVALLQFFVQETKSTGVFVIATHRHAARGSKGANAMGNLLRAHASDSIELRNFDREEIAALIAVESKLAAPEGLVDAVWDKSGGNPLLVRSMLDTDWAQNALKEARVQTLSSIELRAGLMESIAEQIGRVSERCVTTLVAAAFLGRGFSIAALSATSGIQPATLTDTLEESVNARLVAKTSRGRYRFANGLVRDVLYKRVPAAQRPLRHQAAAHSLREAYGAATDAHAAELATQFLGAASVGEAASAVRFSLLAAEAATREGDHARAAKHCSDALEALVYLPSATTDRLAAQLAFAAALSSAGSSERAAAAFLDAAALARAFAQDAELTMAALGYLAAAPRDSLLAPDMLQEAKEAAMRVPEARGDSLREAVALAASRAGTKL